MCSSVGGRSAKLKARSSFCINMANLNEASDRAHDVAKTAVCPVEKPRAGQKGGRIVAGGRDVGGASPGPSVRRGLRYEWQRSRYEPCLCRARCNTGLEPRILLPSESDMDRRMIWI